MRGLNLGNIFNKIAKTGLGVKIRSFFAQEYFRSQIVVWLLILSLAANLADWISLRLFIKPVDFPIILHYNVYFGVDMLGGWKQAFILPFLGLILFLINSCLSLYFYHQKERIASHILLMATLMLQLSLVIASISVIIINY
ncbi:MAG: hypothetical protein WCX17_03260 [Parcubacteria group bacterium]|jgi:hypothetical protein